MAKSKVQRKKQPAAPTAPAGDDSLRIAIATALLDGEGPAALADRLIAEGHPASAARYEVERAVKSPYLKAATRLNARLAKRDWTLGVFSRLAQLDPDRASIPTIDKIDPDRFYRDFYLTNRPVKLTGLVDHWPALERWSLDHFDATLGDTIVELQGNREADPDFEIAKDPHQMRARLRDVTQRLRTETGNDFYLTAYNSGINKQALAPLWADVAPISILAQREPRDGFFWMGPKGTITPYHHDLTNNLLLQIAGRKRIRMVAAHDGPLMRNILHCFSGWDGADLDAGDAAPGRPRVLDCTIGPGEALFLPIGWWHHVEGLDMTIGMSFTNFRLFNDFQTGYTSYGAM
ncbi:hypothetical protein FHS96_003049 [Sphingomonas zeicaulis]|uniref:cupin-like domain-containing protein n=1 Tax=Sphingomonas zeicaulis TaxID=1632740 RepID=UPI003D242353